MSSEIAHLLERVKKVASSAIQAERNGNFEEAFDRFLLAAEILNKMIAMVDIKRIRDSYYAKAKEYITRARELKTVIDHRKQKKTDDFASFDDGSLPSPPKTEKSPSPSKKDAFPSPSEEEFPSPPSPDRSPSPKSTSPPKRSPSPPPPPPPEEETSQDDVMRKMMRGQEPSPPPKKDTTKRTPPPPPKKPTPSPPPKKISKEKKKPEVPTRTTFELFYDQGKYRQCIKECAESVETELRMKLGAFDEHLTLGMLIQKGLEKGMTILREFRHVNILLNRIEHENYRPRKEEAKKAVDITNRILMS